jgi:hypothetical protein
MGKHCGGGELLLSTNVEFTSKFHDMENKVGVCIIFLEDLVPSQSGNSFLPSITDTSPVNV